MFSSPSKTPAKVYIGDRFIPNRNVDNWEIQFFSNDNENRAPLRRPRDANGCLTGPIRPGVDQTANNVIPTATTVITPPVATPNPQNNGN